MNGPLLGAYLNIGTSLGTFVVNNTVVDSLCQKFKQAKAGKERTVFHVVHFCITNDLYTLVTSPESTAYSPHFSNYINIETPFQRRYTSKAAI